MIGENPSISGNPRGCIMSHYNDVIMSAMASQITSLTIVYSIIYLGADQSSASLAFVRGIHRWPVNSPHKWPVTRKMFPFHDVIMKWVHGMVIRADSRFAPSHWETALLCNDVSHWLGASLESATVRYRRLAMIRCFIHNNTALM